MSIAVLFIILTIHRRRRHLGRCILLRYALSNLSRHTSFYFSGRPDFLPSFSGGSSTTGTSVRFISFGFSRLMRFLARRRRRYVDPYGKVGDADVNALLRLCVLPACGMRGLRDERYPCGGDPLLADLERFRQGYRFRDDLCGIIRRARRRERRR